MASAKQTYSRDNIQNITTLATAGGILCNICNEVLERKKWFELHYLKHTLRRSDVVYTCRICRKETSSYNTFIHHCYKVHVSKNRLDPIKFVKQESNNTNNNAIKCKICDMLCRSKEEFDFHYIQHYPNGSEVIYGCSDCTKETVSYKSLQHHFYNVHQRAKFKCKFCSKTVTTKSLMDSHINSFHKNRCSACSKEFLTKAQLKLHIAHLHQSEKPPYSCMSCTDTIENTDACEEHIDLHSKPIFLCQICQVEIKDKKDFANHIEKHFGSLLGEEVEINIDMSKGCAVDVTGGVFCYICKSLYKRNKDFNLHFGEEHNGSEIKYTCNICEKMFPEYKNLADHCNASHVSKNKFKCEVCNKQFHRLSLFINHIRAHHHNPEDLQAPFHCFKCNARYTDEKTVLEHLKKYHQVADFVCLVKGCHELFKTKSELAAHYQTSHVFESDKNCKTCGLVLDSPKSFVQHVHLHKQECHACPICDKEYSFKYCLMQHIPTHFETTLHICKICNKVFKQKLRLTQHIKVHADTKIYDCEVCPKKFATLSQHRQHLDVHKELKSYSCPVCAKAFKNQSNCTKHVKTVHTNLKPLERNESIDKIIKTFDETSNETNSFAFDNVQNDYNENTDSAVNHNIIPEEIVYDVFAPDKCTTNLDFIIEDEICMKQDHNVGNVVQKNIQIKITEKLNTENSLIELLSNNFVNIEKKNIAENPVEAKPLCEYEEFLVDSFLETQDTKPILPHEYGPDFADPAMDQDNHLPHINPLLTLKKETPYVRNLFVYNFESDLEPGYVNHDLKPAVEDSFSMLVDYSEW